MELEQALELELCQESEIHILSCYYRSNQVDRFQKHDMMLVNTALALQDKLASKVFFNNTQVYRSMSIAYAT